jgi:excisionase family DNA binding protein
MMTLPECAAEAGVSRRFLEKEIERGRLRAIKPSSRIVRVRRSDWEQYLNSSATMPAVDQMTP